MHAPFKSRHAHWLSLVLAFPLAACNGSTSDEGASLSEDAEALTSALLAEEPIHYLQRHPIGALAGTPVVLDNGEQLRPDLAAEVSLAKHRELSSEIAAGASALFGSPITTEEFFETDDAAVLTASTSFVVRDPAALRTRSPRFRALRFGESVPPKLDSLKPKERAWFENFKRQMLLKPADHPLGAAARVSDEALFKAALAGKGDVTVTTRVRIPKGGLERKGANLMAPRLSGKSFDFAETEPRFSQIFASPSIDEPEGFSFVSEDGVRTGVSQFVNGFTLADAFDWSERWSFGIGSLEVGAGAWYGVGLRIPIKVTGKITPAEIWKFGGSSDEESSYETELSVDVLDADSDFYEKSGMDPGDIQEGKEFVLNAGAYVHVDASLFGVINADVTLPNNGSFDFGENFQPPYAGCGTSCGLDLWIPATATHTIVDIAGIVTGQARVGFNVSGEGEVDLDYESLYDGDVTRSSRGQGGHETHHLSFTDHDPKTFDTTLAPLESYGEKSFGYRVSDVGYDWGVEVTPGVRGDIHVNGGLFQFDTTIGPFWLSFAKIRLGTVHFGRHAGTRASHDVEKGLKRWSYFSKSESPLDASDVTGSFGAQTQGSDPETCFASGYCQSIPFGPNSSATFEDGELKGVKPIGEPSIGDEELPLP